MTSHNSEASRTIGRRTFLKGAGAGVAAGGLLGPGGSLVPVPTYEGDGLGELTFTEPMITEAYMRDVEASGAEVTTPVPLPAAFSVAGYYPTSYTTRYVGSDDAYAITLENFEWVDAYNA